MKMTESPFPINQVKLLEIDSQKKISLEGLHPTAVNEREAFRRRPHEYTNLLVNAESTSELYRLATDPEMRKLILENSKFAIPPFNKMYILFMEKEVEQDRKEGRLLSFIVTRDAHGEYFTVSPFMINIDKDYTEEEPNAFYPNYSYRINNSTTDKDLSVFGKYFDGEDDRTDSVMELTSRHSSANSFVMQLLFLLIYKRPTYLYTVPASHKMVGNKRVAYAAHKTINLKLFEPKEVISRIAPPTGSHASPRRHDVMGHWMHWNVDIHCDHEWERVVLEEDDPRRRFRENGSEIVRHVCKHCGGRRTFRDHFVRGDATKGCFTHDYVA